MNINIKTLTIGLLLACQLNMGYQAFSQYVIIHEGVPVKLSNKGTLNFSNGTSLTNYSSRGTYKGTIMFSGNEDQSINGSQRLSVANLVVNNSNLVNLFLDVEVLNQLNLNSGVLNLIRNNLYLLGNVQINGPFSETTMIAADSSGMLFKKIPGIGTYYFPLGDIKNGADYSPVTLTFKSGTFTGSYIKINLKNAKHPKNKSKNDYLKRYWTIWQKGISGFVCETKFNYVLNDVVGNEENIFGVYWNMVNWSMLNKATDGIISGNVTLFSDFTGAEGGTFSTTKSATEYVNIFVNENGLYLQAQNDIQFKKIEIYNKIGQQVYSKKLDSFEDVDLALNLNPDLYLIKIQTNLNSISDRLYIP